MNIHNMWKLDSTRRVGFTRIFLLIYRMGSHLHHKEDHTITDRVTLGFLKAINATSERLFGYYLPFRAVIGSDVVLPHSLHGVFVTQRAEIGERVTIYQNATIGSDFFTGNPMKTGAPTIGNDVVICAGSILVGNITVGDGAVIGAGAVVTNNIPAGAVVYSAKSQTRPPSADAL